MYTNRWLYLDDKRTPESEKFDVVRNYKDFCDYITRYGLPAYISFDHDLAEEHYTDYAVQVGKYDFQSPDYASYKEKTGLDCAQWLCEDYIQRQNPLLQLVGLIGVHSSNPVGADNIQNYINGFKKHSGLEPDAFQSKPPLLKSE